MKIDKAIRRLRSYLKWRKPGSTNDNFYESVQLGMEALKRIRGNRKDGGTLGVPLLPGETQD